MFSKLRLGRSFGSSVAVAQDGDITAVEILSDGWSADVTIKGWGSYAGSMTYDDGLDASNEPTASTPTIATTSKSWTSSGVETTIGRTLFARTPVRNPGLTTLDENDVGGDLVVRVALSHFVYSGDTVGAFSFPVGWANNGSTDNSPSSGTCTNISTRPYPQPVAMWGNHDLDWCQSASYTVDLAVSQAYAQQGQGVRAVRFIATDESLNSVSVIVSNETLRTYTGSGKSASVYSAALDFSSLAGGEMVTIDAEVFPWVGDKFTVSTDADSYPSPNLTVLKVLNDYDDGYGTVYAYVDGVGGAGAVHEVEGTAQTTPFDSLANAASALQTYINANFGRNNVSGGIIVLEAGTHVHSSFSARAVGEIPLLVRAASPANKSTTIYEDPGYSVTNGVCDLLKFQDITLRKQGGSVIFIDSGANISSSNMTVFENCDFDINGTSNYGAWVYRVGRLYLVNCDLGSTFSGVVNRFSTTSKQVIAIGSSGSMGSATYHALGSKGERYGAVAADAGNPDAVGLFLGWTELSLLSGSGNNALGVGATIGPRGALFVACTLEKSGDDTGPTMVVNADGSTLPAENVVMLGCTVVGSRTNWLYQDTGSTTIYKYGFDRFNVHWQWNCKSDLFPTVDVNRFGNWSEIYHAGHAYTSYLEGGSASDAYGNNAWQGQIPGLGFQAGTGSVPIDPDWLDDASFQGSQLGNGDYRPGASTELIQIPSGQAPFSYDQNGVALANDGTDYVGALQPAV